MDEMKLITNNENKYPKNKRNATETKLKDAKEQQQQKQQRRSKKKKYFLKIIFQFSTNWKIVCQFVTTNCFKTRHKNLIIILIKIL